MLEFATACHHRYLDPYENLMLKPVAEPWRVGTMRRGANVSMAMMMMLAPWYQYRLLPRSQVLAGTWKIMVPGPDWNLSVQILSGNWTNSKT